MESHLDESIQSDDNRMSIDNISLIGENVTIDDKSNSADISLGISLETPTRNVDASDCDLFMNSPNIIETPVKKSHNLLKLSLSKTLDEDIFVKPSPIAEVMSPARMLQYELPTASTATPTMKRASIDFDFFNKNSNLFKDASKGNEVGGGEKKYEEFPVIVKASTVRHEIEYGKFSTKFILTLFLQGFTSLSTLDSQDRIVL